jgi:hypothetical protein
MAMTGTMDNRVYRVKADPGDGNGTALDIELPNHVQKFGFCPSDRDIGINLHAYP